MGSRKKRWLAIPLIFEAFLSEEFQPAIPGFSEFCQQNWETNSSHAAAAA